jgi:hypothetical protein
VVGTWWPRAVSRGVIEKRDWLGDPARRLVGVPEVVPRVCPGGPGRAAARCRLRRAHRCCDSPGRLQIKPTAQQNSPGKLKGRRLGGSGDAQSRSGFQDLSVNSPDLRRRHEYRGFGHAFGTRIRRTGVNSALATLASTPTTFDAPTASLGGKSLRATKKSAKREYLSDSDNRSTGRGFVSTGQLVTGSIPVPPPSPRS